MWFHSGRQLRHPANYIWWDGEATSRRLEGGRATAGVRLQAIGFDTGAPN